MVIFVYNVRRLFASYDPAEGAGGVVVPSRGLSVDMGVDNEGRHALLSELVKVSSC